ncbi:MAG: Sir2 family NAD-dependent protein deacetylase, partial [Myxococcota bacterium]
TQNIDGLHRIAGNSVDRTYEVHGNGHEMRCSVRCTADRYPIPDGVGSKDRETPLTDDEKALLVCPKCGAVARPHVLWFDEHYEEDFYRSDTAMRAALRAGLFVTVGTSGATSLPLHATAAAAETGAVILDINPNPNPFQAFATDYSRGMWLKGSSSERVPALVSLLIGE